ncbi:hypothetical protein [Actinoplanes sp. HUAS TT8]|uniref:hypothetical protein n=1 Tax=Actinoplanes sp. HUAS TT8 TaxID=3447453 RepID=UPI003F526304
MTIQTPHNEYPVEYPAAAPPWSTEHRTEWPAGSPDETTPWFGEQPAAAPAWIGGHHAAEAETVETGPLPFGGAVPPYGSPENRHGQLLVRFPHAVLGEARPDAPSWKPVVAWTFFLSVLGVVPTMRRAGRAKAYGRPRAPYWIAFLTSLVAGAAFWSFLVVDVAVPIHRSGVESAATAAVQAKVLGDGRIAESVGTKVKSGGCVATDDRGTDGLRAYDCTFLLADGRSALVHIKADVRGNWESAR